MSKDKDKNLKALISKYLVLRGYTKEELATALSISLATLYNRLSKPETFTRGELQRLFKTLHFTDEERLAVI